VRAAAAANPGKRIALWFMDEARVGQKGRLCHRWWARGRRPPGRCDGRFEWAYLFAAVEPATGADVALVLPEATTAAMNLFLAGFAAALPGDVHAALVLSTAPAGTAATPSSSRRTSRSSRCRPTRRS